MNPIIEVKNIGKRYTITHERGRYVALRDVLTAIARKPLAFLADKAKSAAGLKKKEEFWALKDVSFSINKGEVVGIIGRNGAGKSTLLKILSQITPPTEGEITLRGRVGSLLEVGTGFHPELSGRENIFLNGAILGMRRHEMATKFDQIVEFAGIEKFLDTPVKYYSSGMYVRLAFSVAAHMESDILIIDEVLAVGDAEFQKKCLGKMDEISKKEGRTVLFVSHNLAMVQSFCEKAVWLESGKVKQIGDTRSVVDAYTNTRNADIQTGTYNLTLKTPDEEGTISFKDIQITDTKNSPTIYSHEGIRMTIPYESTFKNSISAFRVLISVWSERSQHMVYRLDSHATAHTIEEPLKATGKILLETDPLNLVEGSYIVDIEIFGSYNEHIKMTREFDVLTDISRHGFKLSPDKTSSDYILPHTFKQRD
jgi:lipopolysaccharide transport system ATP-binding protein